MATTVESLLGEAVLSHKEASVPVKSFSGKGKVIGLYFSSCAVPSRDFTPGLVEFYKNFKESNRGNDFEIVFINCGKDESQFSSYFAEMPWLAVPASDRQRQKALMKKAQISRIPALVLIDGESGKIITKNGIGCIEDDPKGEVFPWRPRPFAEIIDGKLLKGKDCEVEASVCLKGKITGLYFSAHWCPPCKHFTPVLAAVFDQLIDEGKNFEVVFVSSDRSQESFNQYFATMPWLAVPYDDTRVNRLKSVYDVYGIPTLIVLDENGKVITKDGRSAINADIQAKEFPWYVKALIELTDATAGPLKENSCLILLTDGEEKDVKHAKETLQDLAEKEHQRGEDERLYFYYGGEDGICDFLREYASLDDKGQLLIITDFPEEKLYICPETEITKEVATDFVNKFFAGTLPSEPLLT